MQYSGVNRPSLSFKGVATPDYMIFSQSDRKSIRHSIVNKVHFHPLQFGCQAASCKYTIGKCILCGENTPHWTTEYCFVQCGLQVVCFAD